MIFITIQFFRCPVSIFERWCYRAQSNFRSGGFASQYKIRRHLCAQENPSDPKPTEQLKEHKPDEFQSIEETLCSNVNVAEITEGDPDKMKKLHLIQLQLCNMYNEGYVPSKLDSESWVKLLSCPTSFSQRKYVTSLWLRETKRREKKLFQERKNIIRSAEATAERPILTTNSPIKYGLGDNTLLRRFQRTPINRFYNYVLLKAMMFNPTILIDCGYEPFMRNGEISLCSKSIVRMWSQNRMHSHPYHIIFTSLNPDGSLIARLRALLPSFDEPDFPFHYTTKSYLDLYDKERLVYLTPYSKETLHRCNPDDVFIIGRLFECFIEHSMYRSNL